MVGVADLKNPMYKMDHHPFPVSRCPLSRPICLWKFSEPKNSQEGRRGQVSISPPALFRLGKKPDLAVTPGGLDPPGDSRNSGGVDAPAYFLRGGSESGPPVPGFATKALKTNQPGTEVYPARRGDTPGRGALLRRGGRRAITPGSDIEGASGPHADFSLLGGRIWIWRPVGE